MAQFDINKAMKSFSYAEKAYAEYKKDPNYIQGEDLDKFKDKYFKNFNSWDKKIEKDNNKYEIDDNELTVDKIKEQNKAEKKEKIEEKKQAIENRQNERQANGPRADLKEDDLKQSDAEGRTQTTKDFANYAAPVASAVYETFAFAGQQAAKQAAKEAAKEVSKEIAKQASQKAVETLGEEGAKQIAQETTKQTTEKATQAASKAKGPCLIAAGIEFATGALYWATRPNMEEHHEVQDNKEKLENEVANEQEQITEDQNAIQERVNQKKEEAANLQSEQESLADDLEKLKENAENRSSSSNDPSEFDSTKEELEGKTEEMEGVTGGLAEEENSLVTNQEKMNNVNIANQEAAAIDKATITSEYVQTAAQGLNVASSTATAIEAFSTAASLSAGIFTAPLAPPFYLAGGLATAGGAASAGGMAQQIVFITEDTKALKVREDSEAKLTEKIDGFNDTVDQYETGAADVDVIASTVADGVDAYSDYNDFNEFIGEENAQKNEFAQHLTNAAGTFGQVNQPVGAIPGMATPGIATPGMATPGIATPGIATPGMATPGMGTPGMATPGIATPGMATPGIATPGMATPGVATPGMGTPGIATPGMGTPGIATPGMTTPGIATPGMGTPGVATPGTLGTLGTLATPATPEGAEKNNNTQAQPKAKEEAIKKPKEV